MQIQKTVWILNRTSGFGIQKFKHLNEKCRVAGLSEAEVLAQLESFFEEGRDFAASFEDILSSGEFESDRERCAQSGIRILSILDSEYPKNLLTIYDPPLILYVKGALIPEDEIAIAIVGSRYPTAYGIKTTGRFSSELAQRGLTVISGFARGIDAEAHRGALRAKGRTIAVLGCGLDVIYPKEHAKLFEQIAESGALISEFPLATLPQAFNFPQRNRVISGLSKGVLVVEAGLKSGSLITARLAIEEGREVYAIPGPIDSMTSSGTNQLIRDGAKLTVGPEDILEDLLPQIRASVESFTPTSRSTSLVDGKLQDPVVQLLGNEPLSFDEIVSCLQEDPRQIRSRMIQLELDGMVRRVFGGRYVLRQRTDQSFG
ncbi:MAG: DNA-protecting protein DprA [Candidatus Omnitrophica bacterium]|nr:DNA-protecting protein DprA [Candidatus Omnitrophota bacterium]